MIWRRADLRIPVGILAVAAIMTMAGGASAMVMDGQQGHWPADWPAELEPFRGHARTIGVAHGTQENIYEIPLTDPKQFESVWPALLKVRSKGGRITLYDLGQAAGPPSVGTMVNNKVPAVRILGPSLARVGAPGADGLLAGPPWADSIRNDQGALPEYVECVRDGRGWVPHGDAKAGGGFRHRARVDLELVVDNKVIDVRKLTFPKDAEVFDRRVNPGAEVALMDPSTVVFPANPQADPVLGCGARRPVCTNTGIPRVSSPPRHAQPPEGRPGRELMTIEIEAMIDGRDYLIIRDNTIQWNHVAWAVVGRYEGHDEPTIITVREPAAGADRHPERIRNLRRTEWLPQWRHWRGYPLGRRETGMSSVFTGLQPAMPDRPVHVALEPIKCRGAARIDQYPSEENQYTLVVDFDDNRLGGWNWYKLRLTISELLPGEGKPEADRTLKRSSSPIERPCGTFMDDTGWQSVEEETPSRR